MANNEDFLDALTVYSKNPSREIPPILDQYLNGVAKNGETLFQWQLLKPLIVGKMDLVVEDLRQRLSSESIPERPNVENVRFDVMHARIMDALHKFNGAPFTIQRLCELLIDPKQHYKRSDKFMRGLEKNVLVVSTVDPYGRKVVSESGSKHLVNGVDSNGSPFFPRDSNISSTLPPVPGWVTTAVTKPTHQQNTPSADSTDSKPTKQPSKDSPTATKGDDVSAGPVSSVYSDQEQPPAIHAEEVIEETVVTMDTNEAGTVATDGGEAMADEDDEEEEMGEDTNASSSSSSSEELSASDASESSGTLTETTITVTSSSETQARPWAAIANEGENKRETASSSVDTSSSNDTDSSQNSEKLSTAVSSEQVPDKQTNSPSSSEASSIHIEPSERDDQADNLAESGPESSTDIFVEKSLNNNSCGFDDPSTPTIADNSAILEDSPNHGSEKIKESDSVVAPDIKFDNSTTDSEDFIPSSTTTRTASSEAAQLDPHEPSSSNICSHTEAVASNHTEVVASSTTDSTSSNVTPLNSAGECDSVAGLERLVDSVEPSQSQASFSSSVPVSAFLPTVIKDTEQPEPSSLSSSIDTDIDSGEPQTEHQLMSDEADPAVSPSSENEALSSNCTPVASDMVADTTSDSISKIPANSSWDQSSEVDESLDTVSCSEKDSDTPAVVSDSIQKENVTSPPSQLLSSGDSQGFDVYGDMLHKNNADEEKQSDEMLTDEAHTQEVTEIKTPDAETENKQEPMDQD